MQITSIKGTRVQKKVGKRGEASNITENKRLKTNTELGFHGRERGKVSD